MLKKRLEAPTVKFSYRRPVEQIARLNELFPGMQHSTLHRILMEKMIKILEEAKNKAITLDSNNLIKEIGNDYRNS